MKPTLLEFNHKRLATIRSSIREAEVLVSIFEQEYPDIPELKQAHWDMFDLSELLTTALSKMKQRMDSESE